MEKIYFYIVILLILIIIIFYTNNNNKKESKENFVYDNNYNNYYNYESLPYNRYQTLTSFSDEPSFYNPENRSYYNMNYALEVARGLDTN